MSERTTFALRALGACAVLQLAACMQGQADGLDDDEALGLEEPGSPSLDGGATHAMTDGSMTHPMGDAALTHSPDASDHAHEGDAGMHAHDDAGGMNMDARCTEGYPTYRPGLSVKSGDLTTVAVSMAPAPPRQRVPNDWVLQLFDASGAPVTDATIANASSFMTVHGHPGSARPRIVPQETPGQFMLDNISFTMRGPWEVLFDVTRQGGRPTLVTFKVCVE